MRVTLRAKAKFLTPTVLVSWQLSFREWYVSRQTCNTYATMTHRNRHATRMQQRRTETTSLKLRKQKNPDTFIYLNTMCINLLESLEIFNSLSNYAYNNICQK